MGDIVGVEGVCLRTGWRDVEFFGVTVLSLSLLAIPQALDLIDFP